MNPNIQENVLHSGADKYSIHIDNFDGPLDVLWDLIKKSKIDITEISISSITAQYIEYLKLMESMNVKIAIEFTWMASELLYYKSKALLPVNDLDDEYFVPPLPPELVARLLEFKKFQKASMDLFEKYENQSNIFTRSNITIEVIDNEEYFEVSLFDLLKAFANVLESQTEIDERDIVINEILVSDKIEFIRGLLMSNEMILFSDVIQSFSNKSDILTSFLAILEMAKMQALKVLQHRIFGEIRLLRNFQLPVNKPV